MLIQVVLDKLFPLRLDTPVTGSAGPVHDAPAVEVEDAVHDLRPDQHTIPHFDTILWRTIQDHAPPLKPARLRSGQSVRAVQGRVCRPYVAPIHWVALLV